MGARTCKAPSTFRNPSHSHCHRMAVLFIGFLVLDSARATAGAATPCGDSHWRFVEVWLWHRAARGRGQNRHRFVTVPTSPCHRPEPSLALMKKPGCWVNERFGARSLWTRWRNAVCMGRRSTPRADWPGATVGGASRADVNAGARGRLDAEKRARGMAESVWLEAARQAVGSMGSANSRNFSEAREEWACPPEVLLTLMVYSYATGTYSSEEIAWKVSHENVSRSICGARSPRAGELRRFRRTCRGQLEFCLALALGRVDREAGCLASASPLGVEPQSTGSSERELSAEWAARRRVDLAMLMDTALEE